MRDDGGSGDWFSVVDVDLLLCSAMALSAAARLRLIRFSRSLFSILIELVWVEDDYREQVVVIERSDLQPGRSFLVVMKRSRKSWVARVVETMMF